MSERGFFSASNDIKTLDGNIFSGFPWLTTRLWGAISQTYGWLWFKKALPNHGQPWLQMLFGNHGYPWLTDQPWSTMVTFVFFCLFSVKTPWLNLGQPTRLVQVPSPIVENRYKVSLLTYDRFVHSGVQWLHKGQFQSLQTCIKMSICVKPIFLYRHILWCQVSKVNSVWKWNN